LWPEAPQKTILSPPTRRRLDLLREKLNEIAQTLNVPPRLIAPKNDLIALAEGRYDGNPILSGWRYEVFGHEAENLLK
jgi:ribonuclease D